MRLLAATNPGTVAAHPAHSAPTAGRAPGIVNNWRISLGERPTVQRGLLTPFPHLLPPNEARR